MKQLLVEWYTLKCFKLIQHPFVNGTKPSRMDQRPFSMTYKPFKYV